LWFGVTAVLAATVAACGETSVAAKRPSSPAQQLARGTRQVAAHEVLNPLGSVPTLTQLTDNFAVLRRPQTAADRSWKPNCSCAGAARQLYGLTRFTVKLSHGYRVFLDVEQFIAGGQENTPAGSYNLNLDIVDRYGNTSSTSFGPNTQYAIQPLSTVRPALAGVHPHGGAVFASVVPDGVASVSWTLGCPRGRRSTTGTANVPSQTVRVRVVNNVAATWLSKAPADCPGVTKVVWRSATGHVITSFAGYGNLPAPPFVAGKLGRGTRHLLTSSGVGSARIGEGATKALSTLTQLLGPPADANVKVQGCAVDSETVWTSPSVADPLSAYVKNGRFVGYQYGSSAEQNGLKHGPGAVLETDRGLTLGDTIGAAKRMYPTGFATRSSSDVGYWSVQSDGARLSGLALPNSHPAHRVAAGDLVAAIGAGMAANCKPTTQINRPLLIPVPGAHASARTRALYYLRLALLHTRESRACPRPTTVPATASGTLNPALLSALAVLRRPRIGADDLPRQLRGNNNPAGRFTQYIRFARKTAGVSYYLVPTSSGSRIGTGLTQHCLAATVSAVHAETKRIPASLRAATLAWTARYVTQEREIETRQGGDEVCLLFAGHDVSGGTCGANATDIQHWGLVSSFGLVSGVVPDGVATVKMHYRAYEGNPAVTDTAKVINNVFVTTITRPQGTRSVWPTIVWRSASGSVLRTISGRVVGVASSGWCGGTGDC
jgi:hypothetical protein